MTINKLMVAMLVAGGLLVGCGDKGEGAADGEGGGLLSAVTGGGKGKPYIAKDEMDRDITVMDRRDASGRTYKPFVTFVDQYQFGDANHQAYIDLYFSKVDEVNREALASFLSEEFRKEKDSFKRQDMLTALAPEMDAYLARVKQIGDIAIDTKETAEIKPYDAEQKGFPMFGFLSFKHLSLYAWEDSYLGVSLFIPDQNLVQDPNVPFVLKADEARAREIEAKLAPLRDGSRNAKVNVIVKGSATYAGGDYGNGSGDLTTVVIPDAFDLVLADTGEVLFTITNKEMLPYYEVGGGYFLDGNRFNKGVSSDVRRGYMEKFGIE